MAELIKIFRELKEKAATLIHLRVEEAELRSKLPSVEMRLQQEKETHKKNLSHELRNAEEEAINELSKLVDYKNLAQKQVEESQKTLTKEWNTQKQILDEIMTQVDGGQIINSNSLPPRLLSLPWSDSRWTPSETDKNSYSPQTTGLAPGIVRVGELLIEQIQPTEKIPAFLPIRNVSKNPEESLPGHITIFSSDAESRQAACAAIQSIALRTIATFPARKIKAVFIDPVSMGNNFPFKKLPDFISGLKTYTRSDDVREQLRSLTVHIEQVIQNYLGTNYQTIEEFNSAKASVQEPYRYLFIADFPANFDNNAWEDLKSILVNGARAGVYVIVHIDETLDELRKFDKQLFENYTSVLRPYFGLKAGAKPKIGGVYTGYVTNIIPTGVYVEFLPGIQGFIHLSKLTHERVSNANYIASLHQRLIVKVRQINNQGEIELTCLDIHPNEAAAAQQQDFRANQYPDQTLFETKLPNGLTFKIDLDKPPANEQFNSILEAITKAFKEAKTETVSFKEFYPKNTDPDKQEWSKDYTTTKEMRAPIGVMGAMEKLEFWLGNNDDGLVVSQSLLAGKPGAGKSYTLHAIIISLAMRYSPDELEMYLLDFKEGVEFQIYVDPERAETNNLTEELNEQKALPHAKVISIESDREFGLSVLKSVKEEIEKRGDKFKTVGVSNLTDYRQKCPNEKMPRILVVIDEFQYIFQERDRITDQLNLIFEDITRRGRAFGVHLLIASQSPSVPNMSNRIYSFIELRLAMQMDKSTAASVLAEGNIDAIDLLEKPGKVIYNKDFGKKGHNEIGQVADVSLKERINALMHIQTIALDRHYQRLEPLVLFNGTRPTKLHHNRQIAQLSQLSNWLSLRELNKQVIQEPDWLVEEYPGVAWLGEAMRIGNHTKAIFRRRPRSNMIIVGDSEETVFGIIGGILISLVHSYERQKAQFRIMDFSQESEDNYWAEMSLNFRRFFSQYFPTIIGKRFPNSGQQIVRAEEILQTTYTEFERRKKLRTENPDEMNLGQSLYFVCAVGGLNRAQNLRPVEGRRGDEPSADAQKIITLASQGAELGIHTILWLDNMKTYSQLTGDNRAWLTHFDLRVALPMPADDSRSLLGETYAQNLPRLRAYFRDQSTTGDLEKFKPYAVPASQEMAVYSKRFQQR